MESAATVWSHASGYLRTFEECQDRATLSMYSAPGFTGAGKAPPQARMQVIRRSGRLAGQKPVPAAALLWRVRNEAGEAYARIPTAEPLRAQRPRSINVNLTPFFRPCCQCYGATVWAGIDELLIGARSEDVEELTEFDEGPLPADWIGELEKRGVRVKRDILREQAREVLMRYGELGGQGD